MIKQDFDVARLISKYLSGEITPDESNRLETWRKEGGDHEELFQKICNDENYAKHELRKVDYDLQTGWEGVEKRIRQMDSRRRFLKLMRYAAMIAVPVLVLVLALQNMPEAELLDESQRLAVKQILPGEAKAILTLDNGETVYLDKNTAGQQSKLADKQIQVDSTTLNYCTARQLAEQKAPVYNKVEIPKGGEYALVLSDGTKVHLNSMSSLRFPVAFGTDKREVELTGEAFFEVSKTGQPFIVHSKGMQIEVLGTVFNVSAYPGEEYQATLVSGSVRVDAGQSGSLVLKPSQQASLTPGSGSLQVRSVDTAFYTSWVKGKINFKDQRLEDIMKTLSRWYDIEVEYANEALKDKRFGCYVNRYGDIAPFIELLEATENIHVKLDGKTIKFYN